MAIKRNQPIVGKKRSTESAPVVSPASSGEEYSSFLVALEKKELPPQDVLQLIYTRAQQKNRLTIKLPFPQASADDRGHRGNGLLLQREFFDYLYNSGAVEEIYAVATNIYAHPNLERKDLTLLAAGKAFEIIVKNYLQEGATMGNIVVGPREARLVYRALNGYKAKEDVIEGERMSKGTSYPDGFVLSVVDGKVKIASVIEATLSIPAHVPHVYNGEGGNYPWKKYVSFQRTREQSPDFFADNATLAIVVPSNSSCFDLMQDQMRTTYDRGEKSNLDTSHVTLIGIPVNYAMVRNDIPLFMETYRPQEDLPTLREIHEYSQQRLQDLARRRRGTRETAAYLKRHSA